MNGILLLSISILNKFLFKKSSQTPENKYVFFISQQKVIN